MRNLKANYVFDRSLLEGQEGSPYWSVSSVGGLDCDASEDLQA